MTDRTGLSNFLATDNVPDTLFGIPVVSREESYSERDLAFFQEHPEAGGYYDLGEETPEDGSREGAPVQDDEPTKTRKKSRGNYPGKANNPGNVEKHERRKNKKLFEGEIGDGIRPDRFANFSDPVKGLNAMATVIARRAKSLWNDGKHFTIENYAPLYAPPSENDTEKYIQNLSHYSKIDRAAILDLNEPETLAKLLKNVVRFESGYPHSEWFTDDEYLAAAERMYEEGSFE